MMPAHNSFDYVFGVASTSPTMSESTANRTGATRAGDSIRTSLAGQRIGFSSCFKGVD